ncbi:MAG: hypothetical protein M1142_04685 [Patescibacteria group bacterium]|nr:hypothetical protein [Patescibacteria group bacterium]
MSEVRQPGPEEIQKTNLRERLTTKAKELPAGVRAAVARAKTLSPRQALLNLAGLTPEAKQRQALAEQERQQQAEARALIVGIDRLFPENAKSYGSRGLYTKEEWKEERRLSKMGKFPWEKSEPWHQRVKASASIRLSDTDTVYFNEDKPSYLKVKGDRKIELQRDYVDRDGIKAREMIELTELPNGHVRLESGSRQKMTGREAIYSRALAREKGKLPVEVTGGMYAGTRPAFEGRTLYNPAAVLAIGKEIVGVAAKGREAQAAQFQQASGSK